MSYKIAKIALWLLMCLPVLILAIFLFANLFNDARKIRKTELKVKQEKLDAINKRKLFDASFDDRYKKKQEKK